MADICTALHLYTDAKCTEPATNVNGLFCPFHGRQVQDLYNGYKRRTEELDRLNAAPPAYLAASKSSLRNETFSAVDSENALAELQKYLYRKYNLLERVIRARKLHHAHFYSQTMDFGHKAYIDKLVNDKSTVTTALERLAQRTSEVLYSKQEWFSWVRETQNAEEEVQEKEAIKIKKEAQLFRRHMKQVESRARAKKRLQQDDDAEPVEDEARKTTSETQKADASGENAATTVQEGNDKTTLSRNAKKRAKAKAKTQNKAKTSSSTTDIVKRDTERTTAADPKAHVNETREELRKRLLEGSDFEMEGMYMYGTINAPNCGPGKIPGMPESEVDKIVEQVAEIKTLLFCRLLLTQAKLLPAALRANSIPEFLADQEVTVVDLRDLCLRNEQPTLQEVRDACADFARGEDDADEEDEDEDQQMAHDLQAQKQRNKSRLRYDDNVPEMLRTQREQANEKSRRARGLAQHDGPSMIDFGEIDDGNFKTKTMRIRVCGKSIFNYPSEKAMARGGWLQFSVIAKGSRFEDAATLCRNWTELWELTTLAVFNYFPSNSWATWALEAMRQQMLKLGIIPYLQFDMAEQMTFSKVSFVNRQRVRGISQAKNVMCLYLKRNDPISRRFVQYLHMASSKVCVLVRDAKTGNVLRPRPPQKHFWLLRAGFQHGADAEPEWTVKKSIGDDLFKDLEGLKAQTLQLGFNDIFDVTVWSTEPGQQWATFYNTIQDAMIKARRMCSGLDMHEPVAPIIKTLVRDSESGRTRDALPHESSLYDELHDGTYKTVTAHFEPGTENAEWNDEPHAGFFYSAVDAEEDLVLFPEEAEIAAITEPTDAIYTELESRGPNFKRFLLDLESDQESDDFEDPMKEQIADRPIRHLENVEQAGSSAEIDGSNGDDDEELLSIPDDIPECPDHGENPECDCAECQWLKEHDTDHQAIVNAEMGELTLKNKTHVPFGEADIARHYEGNAKCWHSAEFDPKFAKQWNEMQDVVAEARTLISKDVTACIGVYEVLMWLKIKPSEHRRVVKDMLDAMAAMSIFFPDEKNGKTKKCLADGENSLNSDQLTLSDNQAKAKARPYARTPDSALSMPSTFWRDADQVLKKARCPTEWDMLIRPRIAQLLKAGLIAPGFDANMYGSTAIATTAADLEQNVYIDYRQLMKESDDSCYRLRDPRSIDLLALAEAFAKRHENARFALLRVWTHALFLPLMLGPDSMEHSTFYDTLGRTWKFKFMPRDFPTSERSMQKNVEDRLFGVPLPKQSMRGPPGSLYESIQQGQGAPRFKSMFEGRMGVKRDMVLVMGRDEADLKRYATAATFVLQSNPWRLEVDLWKSFVNVDLEFLQGLHKRWLE
ncbi:hypothetical protein HII31_13722 [Pseudocercospora fuligena]|uniref:Uncharacterized protein n=1 Tax=Pseudocercospora fuligena TaxID=685502 RepID=A0A8H6VFD7_9PEZI|nr:hypothetical protein HII31_13722 [Pseudocercospora fuligena]